MESKTLEEGLKSGKLLKIHTGMIESANAGANVGILENYDYFLGKLLKDEGYVKALKSAKERGVKIKVVLAVADSPPLEKELYHHFMGAYSYGGIKNLRRYIQHRFTREDKPLGDTEAYDMAKSFERDILGNRKYGLRLTGFISRLFGKVEKIVLK